jgi:oxygen-independent coproporphyrinogen-3 oxidase
VNDALLKDMNRAHNSEGSKQTARLVREAGFDNISMDLIIRLPGQTVEDVRRSVDAVVAWGAKQVVVYDLAVHDETVFGLRRRKGELALPPEEIHAEMFAAAESGFAAAGLAHYEVASFARPGFESKHNLIYWRNQPYLGLGPGAFSYIDGNRTVYAKTVRGYIDKAMRGDWANDEEDVLSQQEIEYETLLTGVRLTAGFELSRVPLIRAKIEAEADALAEQGLVEYDGQVLCLTQKGRYLAETVFAILIRNKATI